MCTCIGVEKWTAGRQALPSPALAHLHVAQGVRSSGVAQPGRRPRGGPGPGWRLPTRPAPLLAAPGQGHQQGLHRCAGCWRGHRELRLWHALREAGRHSGAGQTFAWTAWLARARLGLSLWSVLLRLLRLRCRRLMGHSLLLLMLLRFRRLLGRHSLLLPWLHPALQLHLVEGIPPPQVCRLLLLLLLLRLMRFRLHLCLRHPSCSCFTAALCLLRRAARQGLVVQQHAAGVLGCQAREASGNCCPLSLHSIRACNEVMKPKGSAALPACPVPLFKRHQSMHTQFNRTPTAPTIGHLLVVIGDSQHNGPHGIVARVGQQRSPAGAGGHGAASCGWPSRMPCPNNRSNMAECKH